MVRGSRAWLIGGSLEALLLVALAAAPAALAAPARLGAEGAAPGGGNRVVPGKGDADGDRIADDLAAALDAAGPGERVRVIVQGVSPVAARREAPSLRMDRRYHAISAFAGSVTVGQVRALAHVPGVSRIELDGITHAMDASGNFDYGVTAARGAGAAVDGTLDGSGVGICMIDTGIDPAHEQLAGRIVGWRDWVNGLTTPYDDHGHGTHVSGIAAGRATGPANAAYAGVAPGASLIGAKVLDSTGNGADADVVSAIEWCAARSDVDVISMSLGSPASDGSDAASQMANAAVAAGKVVVVAAGNSGDGAGTISSPGVATDVVTVGAASDPSSLAGTADTDSGLYLAGFSSRGPTTNPAAPLKPDVVAPGLSVVAAQAGTTSSYLALSGTSMATPFVAGVVALGLEAAPAATPAQVKNALRASAQDAGATGPDNEWGFGLVDARAFVAALGAAAPGTAPWPNHQVVEGSVGSGAIASFPITVTTAGVSLAVTLRTTNGHSTCALQVGADCWYGYEWAPDIDAYLVDPSGTVVSMSRCMLEASNGNCAAPGRFETLSTATAVAGTWSLRVESFSGTGTFQADVFGAVGSAPPPPTPPAAPSDLVATAASTSSIGLTWTDRSSDETGFEVQRCQGSGCTAFARTVTLAAGSTSYADTGLAAGTYFSYRVRAVNGALVSAWSATATGRTLPATTKPTAPTGLTATAASSIRVDLRWTDTSTNETGVRVLRCIGAKCTKLAVVATLPANTTNWSDLTTKANTTYRYKVEAYNSVGSSASSIVTVKTPPI
ncbi:MAG: S8 family serine peptidase [Nocardioides sp.]